MRTSKGAGMKSYRVLLFDIDGTLLDFQAAEREGIAQVLRERGISPSHMLEERYHQINDSYWRAFERGEIGKDEIMGSRFRTFFETMGIDTDGREEEAVYRRVLDGSAVLMDGALEVCRKLRESHRMYIVTNGVSQTQYSRLALSGLDAFFDDVFVSEDAGSQKPQEEFFSYCLSRMPLGDREKSRMLLIGDSLRSDIRGANAAGIAACWYNPLGLPREEGVRVDWEIRDLWELYQL